jgi:hypothetical protein
MRLVFIVASTLAGVTFVCHAETEPHGAGVLTKFVDAFIYLGPHVPGRIIVNRSVIEAADNDKQKDENREGYQAT